MFSSDPLADPQLQEFLANWNIEIRAGATPASELLSEVDERFLEHFPDTFAEETEEHLLVLLRDHTDRLIAEEQAREATWIAPTTNDVLSAVFATLREKRITALESAGLTIHDGWGYVGAKGRVGDKGAVFFHQQDVIDAIHGDELLLAFGGFESDRSAHETSSKAIAEATLDVLANFGIAARWSGGVEERIRIAPFEWRARRWTQAPTVRPQAQGQLWRTWEKVKRAPDEPEALAPARLSEFTQAVVAHRTTWGFDLSLSQDVRRLWKALGGSRGQVGHGGTPHVFLRAGELTTMIPRNAYANLAPEEATALRLRGAPADA